MTPDRYAVIGNPVGHSRSPAIHALFARQLADSIDYTRLECPNDAFVSTVRQLATSGAKGCNVTVPFKFEAYALGARTTPRARLAGAANTLRFDSDAGVDAAGGAKGWFADNTDGIGLVRDIEINAGVPLAGSRVLLIGAGGAAAGALGPLIEAGPSQVVIANRTRDKGMMLAARHLHLARTHQVMLLDTTLDDAGRAFDVVINASSTSLAGEEAPVDEQVLAPDTLAIDLMYGPLAVPFVEWARRHHATGRDGLGMLVEQAAEAFFIWRGQRPDTALVLAEMRRQLDVEPS